MVSIGFQRFTMVQSICLILIFFDKLMISLKIVFVLLYSTFSYFYLHKKMEQLLLEMNFEIKDFYLSKYRKKNEEELMPFEPRG
jgi:hypothetical protein